MPHRAGYFVLAYNWDHHCDVLYRRLTQALEHAERETGELAADTGNHPQQLLNYYKKWHYNNILSSTTLNEVRSRQFVINCFGYRGYGVNKDLLAALAALEPRCAALASALRERFAAKATAAQHCISLPRERIRGRDSAYVIAELCRKLGRDPAKNIPGPHNNNPLNLHRYFHVMSQETPHHVNTAIFSKMFFAMGASSATIMKGSAGLHNGTSSQVLKRTANANLVNTARHTFSNLHCFTEIGIDLLRSIHADLSRNLNGGGGTFRLTDFPDRNGVTFEFANFQKEIENLAIVLGETARSFHDIDAFLYNLARSYYMLIGIHPFWDGNGRVGRAFLNMQLLKKGLPPLTFDDAEEVAALPRYGGSMDDMHAHLRRRLRSAINDYFYERWKIESFGLWTKTIRNPAFDSGFSFRQIDDAQGKIQVQFPAYIVDDRNPLFRILLDECRVVLPESRLLNNLAIYYGFADRPFQEWHHGSAIRNTFYHKELRSADNQVRVFDVDFTVDIPQHGRRTTFNCSVTCEEKGLIFNNKGLNYSYRIAP
jgi:fido (protein-threonine AMPylation protein)